MITHIGGNDFLGAVLSGVAIPGVTLTPVERFRSCYRSMVQAIAASGASVVIWCRAFTVAFGVAQLARS